MRNELLLATGICLLSAGLAEAQQVEGSQFPLLAGSNITLTPTPQGIRIDGEGGGGGGGSTVITGVGSVTVGGTLPVQDLLLENLISGGALSVGGTVTALPSGTQAISAASLPLPTGAATAANQTTANTSLGSIVTALGSPVQAGSTLTIAGSLGITSVGSVTLTNTLPVSGTVALSGGTIALSSGSTVALSSGSTVALATGTTVSGTLTSTAGAPIAPGAATATTSVMNGCIYNSTLPTFTNGQQGAVQCDANGKIYVDGAGGGSSTVTLAAGTANVGTVALSTGGTVALATGTTVSGTLTSTSGAPVAPGTATATSSQLAGCIYNSTAVTFTTGQQGAEQCDANGRFYVDLGTALPAGTNVIGVTGVTQGSTTSGQSGNLEQAAVTTAAPSYTTAQTQPLSLNTAGDLRVGLFGNAGATVDVAVAGGAASTNALQVGGEFLATPSSLSTGYSASMALASTRAAFVDTEGLKQTFRCSAVIVPAATPTDVFGIIGSASKTVHVKDIILTTTATTAGNMTLQIAKRSTADSAGSSTPTAVPLDSANAAAGAACKNFTANPTTGTLVGYIDTRIVGFPVAGTTSATDVSLGTRAGQAATLRGVAQELDVNLAGGALPTGASLTATIEWTESTE
jgi:hypothetical protein